MLYYHYNYYYYYYYYYYYFYATIINTIAMIIVAIIMTLRVATKHKKNTAKEPTNNKTKQSDRTREGRTQPKNRKIKAAEEPAAAPASVVEAACQKLVYSYYLSIHCQFDTPLNETCSTMRTSRERGD